VQPSSVAHDKEPTLPMPCPVKGAIQGTKT